MVKETQLGNTNTGAFLFSNTKSCMNGGSKGYGVTFESLKQASESGLGRSSNANVTLNNCPQTGGNMADVNNNSMTNSYGYLKGDNETNALFRGSYAAVDKHQTAQSCKSGGKKDAEKERKAEKAEKVEKVEKVEDVEERQINAELDIVVTKEKVHVKEDTARKK